MISVFLFKYNLNYYKDYLNNFNSNQLYRYSEIRRLTLNKNKIEIIFTELLLRYIFKNFFELNLNKNDFIKINKEKNYKILDTFFSISHTYYKNEGFIVIALNKFKIGIDIEIIKPFNKGIIERFFSQEESKYIYRDKNISKNFFEVWTRKEALYKLIFKKQNILFLNLNVNNNLIKTFYFNKYILSIASLSKIELKSIKINIINKHDINKYED